jgi:hypothetical protein
LIQTDLKVRKPGSAIELPAGPGRSGWDPVQHLLVEGTAFWAKVVAVSVGLLGQHLLDLAADAFHCGLPVQRGLFRALRRIHHQKNTNGPMIMSMIQQLHMLSPYSFCSELLSLYLIEDLAMAFWLPFTPSLVFLRCQLSAIGTLGLPQIVQYATSLIGCRPCVA